jgi:hypothetical protein
LRRVWPDRDGNISYLLTVCVDGRAPVLNNDIIFARLVAFLLESPARYRWFGRRFVIMPDHIHLIAHLGHEAIPLGQWMKALKAVVGGLEIRVKPNAGSGDPAYRVTGKTQHPSRSIATTKVRDLVDDQAMTDDSVFPSLLPAGETSSEGSVYEDDVGCAR